MPQSSSIDPQASRLEAQSGKQDLTLVMGLPIPPFTGLAGLRQNWQTDALSGFLVFLVALPLCLGISIASNFPPAAGILTAIVGGVFVGKLGGGFLTINGPAAGMIAIVVGSVQTLGGGDLQTGYRNTLAVIVVASVLQIVFGLFKAGRLMNLFPAAAVHGMLAAIGLIIISKQIHTVFGVKPTAKEPIDLFLALPETLAQHNPFITIIGLFSLYLLISLPLMNVPWLRKVPAQLLVLIAAIALTSYFSLEQVHNYSFQGQSYAMDPIRFLVTLPYDLVSVITFPDFSALALPAAWGYVLMFALVGSIESLLTCQAIDALDPFRRKTDMNRSILVIGIGNLICGFVGGLPMIAEVVRSSANIANGARTRWANIFHGLFLFAFVYFLPGLLQQIPLAALAAMLVFTGYRLAAPKHFIHSWKEGHEQFLIFVVTIAVTLWTDLLLGISAGILINLAFHFWRGANLQTLFKARFTIETSPEQVLITYQSPAIFTNYIALDKALQGIPANQPITIDFSEARLVDHTTQERLRDQNLERMSEGGGLTITGLDHHIGVALHPLSTKVRPR